VKRLTLIRHATAQPALGGQEDWDRALEARGIKDAHAMGVRLRDHGFKPDLFLSSPAVRALTTAQHLAQAAGLKALNIEQNERLYLASAKELLAVAQELGARHQHLVLLGHNPGLSEFADQLSSERSIDNMPTCAVVHMDFGIEQWRELAWSSGTNVVFDYPSKR
jgi:phosphohistidine phosphatase